MSRSQQINSNSSLSIGLFLSILVTIGGTFFASYSKLVQMEVKVAKIEEEIVKSQDKDSEQDTRINRLDAKTAIIQNDINHGKK